MKELQTIIICKHQFKVYSDGSFNNIRQAVRCALNEGFCKVVVYL